MDTYGAPLCTHGHMHTAHHPFPHVSIRPFRRSSSVLPHAVSSRAFPLLASTITATSYRTPAHTALVCRLVPSESVQPVRPVIQHP